MNIHLYLKGYKVFICFVGKEESRSRENLIQKKICDYYKIPVVNDLKEVIINDFEITSLKDKGFINILNGLEVLE